MRLIDADVLNYKAKNEVLFIGRHNGKSQAQLEFIVNTLIEHTPTIDAVPVVRCKDCKHYWKNKNTPGYLDKCVTVSDDDYCSDGERKDGAE